MPELPEVESVRQGLEPLIGQRILHVHLGEERCLRSLVPEHSLALDNLEGQRLLALERKGKFLQISTEDLRLTVHLGMSGVLLYNADKRAHTHIELHTEGGWLRYSDPRRFGLWELQTRHSPNTHWDKLGPDALEDLSILERIHPSVQQSRRTLKDLLLDQGLISGIGNIYACEALFAAGIHPLRKGCELERDEWKQLVRESQRILRLSIANKGTTFSDYRLTNGKGGAFQAFLQVFQKEGQACPTCHTPIQRILQAQRSTFFCPCCQH